MKASVIILTKNAGSRFDKVLQAVLDQETGWQYEVLVVDSGSTDSTVEYVESKQAVRLHQIPAGEFGHGKTRNLAISLTTGEYAAMLTHDALPVNKTWLAELVAAVEQSEDVAGAFGRHVAYQHDGPFLARDLQQHFDGFLQCPQIVRRDDEDRYQREAGYRQFLHFFSDNNACLRRSVWEEIPYPEVEFAEDQLWAKNIIEAGYAKAYADKAVVYHSHTFGPIELCRRSFDESRALRRLFGYQLCPTVLQMLVQSCRTTANDFMYLRKNRVVIANLGWVIRAPFRNTAKQLGYYLGQRAERLPNRVVSLISRDMSLQRKR